MVDKERQRKFIFIGSEAGTPLIDVYSDLCQDERAEFLEILPHIKNPILRAIRKIHCSGRINGIIKLPFKDIWHSAIDDIKWEQNVEYHIVFLSCPFVKRSISYWARLKKEYNVKYSMYQLSANDSFSARSIKQLQAINEFDRKIGFERILTTQPRDAEKYGYILCYYCCSIIGGNTLESIENDLYLINNAKGRLKQFLDVYESSKQNSVKSFFRITGVKKDDQLYSNEIIYNKVIGYKEAVKEMKKSNCLFEVLGEAQTGASMHYYEAVLYNKKLLTDNKSVVDLPFYNSEYMHVFEKAEDIDWNWVKERIPVDYNYDGRYSPTNLIEEIIKLGEVEKEAEF